MWSVLIEELTEHMAVPMLLMLVLTFGATLLSIRRSLRPVSAAAAAAETLDPLDPRSRLSEEGMPREIAGLIGAMNRALSRIGDVMRAQKSYTTAIAHEVRVPLAAMKLALNQIADPAARKIDEDIDRLSHLVTQLTDLGRLDAFDRSAFANVDLVALGRKVVEDMAPLVFESGREIGFAEESPSPGFGLAVLIEDAVRNLVDNAIAHTPPGTSITVSAGPGPAIRVIDTAGIESDAYRLSGAPGTFKRGDRVGIGLDIVRKIVDLHEGTFKVLVEPGRMTSVEITIPPGA
jgi:signal transduction histidine kinase